MKIVRSINLSNSGSGNIFLKRGGYLLLLLILILSGCGIAVPYYLNPPTYFTNLSFHNAYINDPSFAKGYEFFYRIYDDNSISSSTAISDAGSFFNETTLLGLISNNRSLFGSSYYRRIFPVSDDIFSTFYNPAVAPIVKVDPAYFDKTDSSKNFLIDITILGTTNEGQITLLNYFPSAAYPKKINFMRYVTDDGSTFTQELFNSYSLNQDDVPDSITDNTGSIAFFVVLYGLTDQFIPVFSDVVYIGSIDNITIN